jgi:hypothetical protein
VNWFKLHNPVTFDFVDRSLIIGHEGTTYTFQDHVLPKNNFVITPMECSKLFAEQAQGYILYNIQDVQATLSELENTVPPAEFQDILQAFADVFAEPEGLPPHRSSDHTIPLLPGSKPPNIRPYRMSHTQKNTIETIIPQMLKNKEIQPSYSSLSSPIILIKKKDKS